MSDLAESLAEALDELDHPQTAGDESNGRFIITNTGQADWALRKITQRDRRVADVTALAAREIERIRTWAEAEVRSANDDRAYFAGLLEEWHRTLLAEDPKAKTVKLPHGTLSARQSPATWTFDDEPFIAWAQSNAPALLRIKTEVNKVQAKKDLELHTQSDGEMVVVLQGEHVPGVAVTPGDVQFSVKTETASRQEEDE